VWEWTIDAAVLAGKLQAPGYADDKRPWRRLHARPHGWPFVNVLQDVQAKSQFIEAGLSSRQEEREKMPGANIEEIDEQRRQDHARERGLGLAVAEG
jgi:capsid protein